MTNSTNTSNIHEERHKDRFAVMFIKFKNQMVTVFYDITYSYDITYFIT